MTHVSFAPFNFIANLIKNQSEVNRMIKSFIPKIPEHLFYTALPQVSLVFHLISTAT